MIEFYYAPTPNGQKVILFLEEAGTPYEIKPVNILKGDQFKPSFIRISPSNRMPAIVDTSPNDGGAPLSVFESGAILHYLGEKTGKFFPTSQRDRARVYQWLYWQMGGLGPMAGQANHFLRAAEQIPYAINRYVTETGRLYAVLDRQIGNNAFVTGTDYTIADMAIYPWVARHEMQTIKLEEFPNVQRWYKSVAERPATKRAYEIAEKYKMNPADQTEEEKKMFLHQSAETVRKQKT